MSISMTPTEGTDSTTDSDSGGTDTVTVSWNLARGTSALITRTADLLGRLASRDGILSDVLQVGLEEMVIIRCSPVDLIPDGPHTQYVLGGPTALGYQGVKA